jgi:hypothetical protein
MWAFLAFGGAALGVSLCGRILVAAKLALVGLADVSLLDPETMRPTVSSWVEVCLPFKSIGWFVASSLWVGDWDWCGARLVG